MKEEVIYEIMFVIGYDLDKYDRIHVDGLVQEWRNSSALAMELRLFCTNPSMYFWQVHDSRLVIVMFFFCKWFFTHFNLGLLSNFYKTSWDDNSLQERLLCLVHPAVRDKRRVSEIDLSQPRHETAFWWHHNGPVTSQLTDPIKWRNYPFELMFKCAYINTHNKESMTQRYRISTNVQLCLIFLYISIWFES